MRLIRVLNRYQSRYRIGSPWIDRNQAKQLQVNKQLYKYGFKPNSYSTRFFSTSIFMLFTFLAGFIYNRHKQTVHDVLTIKPNSQVQAVMPTYQMKLHQMFYSLKLNFMYFGMGLQAPIADKISPQYQALIRIQQFNNFKKNRNKKIDFMNIGEVAQYPFPNLQQEMGMNNSQ